MLLGFTFLLAFAMAKIAIAVAPATIYSHHTRIYCGLYFHSVGVHYLNHTQLEQISSIAEGCKSRAISVSYVRIGQFQPEGESLADLNDAVEPLLGPSYRFRSIEISISEAMGLSVGFTIPDFGPLSHSTVLIVLLDFRLLNEDGSEAVSCSANMSKTAPFSNSRGSTTLMLSRGIRYHESTCDLIFNRAFIASLRLFELTYSTIKHNRLTFRTANQTLNSTVFDLFLRGYQLSFDSRIFSLNVFARTQMILFTGTIDFFEAQTLQQSMVTRIELAISRLRKFFHNNPNWLGAANQRSSPAALVVEINDARTSSLSSTAISYTGYAWLESKELNAFDDSSFCIFYRIELSALHVTFKGRLVERQARQNCSCLLLWIILRHSIHSANQKIGNSNLCGLDKTQLEQRCGFDKMAQRCSIESVGPLNYRTVYDTILDLEYFKYLADVWLVPLTSLLGIMANYLVIRTFGKIKRSPEYRKNKLTDKSRLMWDYAYFNSWFILFHATILACSPLTTCIEYNGIYCPQLALTRFSRAFYLFVASFLGNVFRLAANLSSTLFVLFRYGLNTDRLSRFRKLKPKRLIALLLIPSTMISVVTLFINERLTFSSLHLDTYNYLVNLKFDQFNQELALKIVYLVNTLLGTILLALFNIFIDLRLLCLLRKHKTLTSKEDAEKRITMMVILSGMFSFFFRLPEMISALLMIVFIFHPEFFLVCLFSGSRFHSVCPILFDLSRFLMTISFLENLVLLYLFNPNFRKHFQ
nr:G protein-coupled receptor [Proales similis]